MLTKEKIFNLALSALLLSRQVTNAAQDASSEAKILNTHWDTAFLATLSDLDLDSTSTQGMLELLAEHPLPHWHWAYKYPQKCAFFRRIRSHAVIDNKRTHIPKRVAIWEGQKVIFTNHHKAIAEYISTDVPITSLTATAGLCIAYRLAWLSAPLTTGKGAVKLIADIEKKYVATKAEAQAQDERENFCFQEESTMSEFVEDRLS